MPVPEPILPFWHAYAATQQTDPTPRFLEAFFFGDGKVMADGLADLVLAGRKRATASLLWSFEEAAVPLPRPGLLSVVTNFDGGPLCVIETRQVEIVPFEEVTAEFAAAEGEGDGSLESWRKEHIAYFARECRRIHREPHPRMPVVCERFEVVHRAGVPGADQAGGPAGPRRPATRPE